MDAPGHSQWSSVVCHRWAAPGRRRTLRPRSLICEQDPAVDPLTCSPSCAGYSSPSDSGVLPRCAHGDLAARRYPVTGEDRFTGPVIFPDAEDALMDSWTDAAIDLLDGLAALAGHESGESLVNVDADDPVALGLRLRGNTKGDE